MTIAVSPIFWKASQPPSAKPGFNSTPSSVALMSVRGSAILTPFGAEVLERYRRIHERAAAVAADDLVGVNVTLG